MKIAFPEGTCGGRKRASPRLKWGPGHRDRAYVSIQELLGHNDVGATMIHTRALNRGGCGARRPLDR